MGHRKPFVAANWKLHGSRLQLEQFTSQCLKGVGDDVDVVFCPSHVHLDFAASLLGEQVAIKLGAQNVSQHTAGAYTGEVSCQMLVEAGCRYVLVGHSERRRLFGETSFIVAEKFAAARAAGLVPILCLGESGAARQARRTFEVIAEELDIVIEKNGAMAFDNAIIAYEPIWAVGTGKCATPEQAQEVHSFIRGRLAEDTPVIGEKVRIIYGGSMTPANARDLFAQHDVDGGLIGGASLDSDAFLGIVEAAKGAS
ncbi:triose-phosphate isomerase [Aeromonas enteropelogenes]|uniref:Triosephosphate isomerase n=1 Tax=Aeromonas enteropelogenes TaxID=29489 RepID=A0A175VK67_AEREN|nr:triose-phosphate isomerase [Aeromonas enteropelogenes]KXU81031.1 triose-phosphate isomerase [Aeromonas enteropelogenes]